MIPEDQIFIRLLVGAILGMVIGFERERHHQPAGLRTHTILVIGATLAMVLSINTALRFRPDYTGDPARLAAQVIPGIGFLGAGAILRYGVTVRGLTTATSLWTMAIVGLTAGAGYLIVASGATVLIFVILSFMNKLEDKFSHTLISLTLVLKAEDTPGLLDEIQKALMKPGKSESNMNIRKNLAKKTLEVEIHFSTYEQKTVDLVIADLSVIKGVHIVQSSQ